MLNKSGQIELITSWRTTFARAARKALAVAVTASLVSVGFVEQAQAQATANGLDPTFGGDGVVTTRFFNHSDPRLDSDDRAADVVLQPDGKIVVAGTTRRGTIRAAEDFAVARYDGNGVPDKSFGVDGKQKIDFGTRGSAASAVALQPDGKIIVAGYQYTIQQQPFLYKSDFALARLNRNGRLDATFGTGGKVVTDFFDGPDFATSAAIQPDGKIVLAGVIRPDGAQSESIGLARYHSDGSLDQTFGTDGKATQELGEFASVQSMVIQPDGKFLVAAASTDVSQGLNSRFSLSRFHTDGSPDTTFGPDGLRRTEFFISSLALQPDGKIVAAGNIEILVAGNIERGFAVARYNTDGSPDTTFDGDGKQTTNFSQYTQVEDVTVLSDGKILVAGHLPNIVITFPNAGQHSTDDFALARYNADGSPDTAFDDDGKLVTDLFSCSFDSLSAIAVQPDGKVVAVGSATGSSFRQSIFVVARYGVDPTSSVPRLFSLKLDLRHYVNGTYTIAPAVGGRPVTGRVELCSQATSDVAITLSDTLAAALAPASVTVPAGQTVAAFTIKTRPVTALETGAVTATLDTTTKSTQLRVRPIGVLSLTLNQISVEGPRTITGLVTLEHAAPAGGITVTLSSSDPATASPSTSQFTISPGSTRRSFTIRVNDVSSTRYVLIKATANGISKSEVLTVQ